MLNDEEIDILMTMPPRHLAAIDKAKSTLSSANILHADSDFGGDDGNNAVVDNCFNPARAGGHFLLHGKSITTLLDTNTVSKFRKILAQMPGESLDEEGKAVIAFLLLSAVCDGKIAPGLALLEMDSTTAGRKYLNSSFHAFEYLCSQVEIEDLFDAVLTEVVPIWRVQVPEIQESYSDLDDFLTKTPQSQRHKSELFSALIAATIERTHRDLIGNDVKLEMFIQNVFEKGAFALGSLRYFSFYFSDMPAQHGLKRGEMLKSVRSESQEKLVRGVINAAADCIFASEYARSLNTFHQRGEPQVFATADRALQLILEREYKGRSLWDKGVSEILADFRGGSFPTKSAEIVDANVRTFDVGNEPTEAPKLRSAARVFLDDQDRLIKGAWCELLSLSST